MSDHALECPGCGGLMRPREVAHGARLHLCPTCGGTFADGGALDQALGEPVEAERLEGHTDRRCAFCRITMTPALLGSIPVELCTACTGIYLDHGELEELAPELDLPARRVHEATGGFSCVSCSGRFPMAQGNVSARGLACRECIPISGLTERERSEANLGHRYRWYEAGPLPVLRLGPGLMDLLIDAWTTFRSGRAADVRDQEEKSRSRSR
jgi:Zn-finger nucleic acid-binding protein